MHPLIVVFVSVFIAELGDKTQLATILFASGPDASRLGVFLAASLALVLSSLVAVLLGDQISRWVTPSTMQLIAGLGFIAIGIVLLAGSRG